METKNIICLESDAFEALVDRVVLYLKESQQLENTKEKWITTEQAMKKLNITSKTTLQNLRDTGKIRYSQPMHKVVLYDSTSIDDYLEKNARNTF